MLTGQKSKWAGKKVTRNPSSSPPCRNYEITPKDVNKIFMYFFNKLQTLTTKMKILKDLFILFYFYSFNTLEDYIITSM